jgi:hypothetical protein
MDYQENWIGRIAAAYRDPLLRPIYVDEFQSLDSLGGYDLPQPGNYLRCFRSAFRTYIPLGLNVWGKEKEIQQKHQTR